MNGALIVLPVLPEVSTSLVAARKPRAAATPLSATRTKQPFSIAWAAGFIDGEGCISITRVTNPKTGKVSFTLVCTITQNDRDVLEHLRNGVGIDGRIYTVKRRSFHTKPVFCLNFVGEKAMEFIALLTPHLVRKRAEALTAWTYWVEGRAAARFGPKGLPPEIRAIRERLFLKMRSQK